MSFVIGTFSYFKSDSIMVIFNVESKTIVETIFMIIYTSLLQIWIPIFQMISSFQGICFLHMLTIHGQWYWTWTTPNCGIFLKDHRLIISTKLWPQWEHWFCEDWLVHLQPITLPYWTLGQNQMRNNHLFLLSV